MLQDLYNNQNNENGKLCKVIFGNIIEGISLKNVGEIHIVNPWWNESRLE
jgi:hypothetical protein